MTYFRTKTDGQESSVRTDTTYKDHILALLAAIDNGWLVGSELCMRWWVSPGDPYYHEHCEDRDTGQGTNEFLDDYLSGAHEAQQKYPPV